MTENEQLRQDPEVVKYYGEILDRYPDHEITRKNGRVHWKPNQATLLLWNLMRENNMSLVKLWDAYAAGTVPVEDIAQFYRDIGYHLGGYMELFELPLNLTKG